MAPWRVQEGRRLGPKPRTRKMIGMISVILAAIALIMVGYLAVGFAGYLAFPRTVSSNVLKTFPDTAIMQVPQRGQELSQCRLPAHAQHAGAPRVPEDPSGWDAYCIPCRRHVCPISRIHVAARFVPWVKDMRRCRSSCEQQDECFNGWR